MMNNYLYSKINALRELGAFDFQIPKYICEVLNNSFELRKYQIEAFENFIYYYENTNLRKKPTHLLFHMATGSGKTLIMAGLIIYLYKQGYRNFLFFVNSKNIIEKTKDNFLNKVSNKYLFNHDINIDGEIVKIKEVSNFQMANDNDINICFTTIHGLHWDVNFVRENRVSLDDFESEKIVMISDEAHHINSITKIGKLDKNEKELLKSWEYTVDRILSSNRDNVLLDFTATCDIDNELLKNKYIDKIIYNYPLSNFREDKYSKEVNTLQSNVSIKTKMLQAVLLSQYRLKVFQYYKVNIKPVILFKSDIIENSKINMQTFCDLIDNLSDDDIYTIKENATSEILIDMFAFYEAIEVSIPNLVREIKDEFSINKCISVNDDNEAYNMQIVINSLENKDNPYRAIFEVRKLDEGWDVLNLYDIVRLYETRDAKNNRPGQKTVQEAQLIGRGARYCPFVINDNQDKYKRKFDEDLENPLRICETLLYHCQNDSKYISELKVALRETGIIPLSAKRIEYKIKDNFKNNEFYKNGLIFFNKRALKDRNFVTEIPNNVRDQLYYITFSSGSTKTQSLFSDEINFRNLEEKLNEITYKIKDIAKINYNIILRNLRKIDIYKFSTLKKYFPNLKSMQQFIIDDRYLGNISICINSIYNNPPIQLINEAVFNTLSSIKNKILFFDETFVGTSEFYPMKFNQVFKDKVINVNNPGSDSVGISQNDVDDESIRLDLSNKDWYVYNDNFGTTLEKRFVKYFSGIVDELHKKFSEVFLIRNERSLPIYSFRDGERFEPDYLLILIDGDSSEKKQYQIFIEVKGDHLLLYDKWKEEFLLSLAEKSTLVDNNKYLILGFPFYNNDNRMNEFNKSIQALFK